MLADGQVGHTADGYLKLFSGLISQLEDNDIYPQDTTSKEKVIFKR